MCVVSAAQRESQARSAPFTQGRRLHPGSQPFIRVIRGLRGAVRRH